MNGKAELAVPKPHDLENPWKSLLAVGVIIVAALAAYHNTFSVPLLYDDKPSIANNPTLRHLSTAFWPPPDSAARGRPVLNLSLALNYAISGVSVWSYHGVNVAIHILAGLTLLGIVRRTLATRAGSPAPLIAFSVALLWTIHPLQTEAVTYIVQRAESLMGLFYLLTLYCFIRGAGAAGRCQTPWFALSVGSCVLGMATKEVMVSAPLIVLLYDRTFVAGSFREAFRRRWRVFVGMAATWLVLAYLVFSAYGRSGTPEYAAGIAWWHYALTQFQAITQYIRLCFWPYPLIFDYGTALVPVSLQILPYALFVIGLLAATLWALVKQPTLGFLGASFFVILAPTSSFAPVAGETMADYRMYLPLIPIMVLVVLGIFRRLGRASLAVCLVLAVVLGLATARRNRDFASEQAIWSDTVARRPDNDRAHNNLGEILANIAGRLPDATDQFEAALRINPNFAKAQNNLGAALANAPGRLPDAIAHFEAALRIDPGFVKAHDNLGAVLLNIPGRLPDAIAHFEAALRIDPNFAKAHDNLGEALGDVPGRLPDAIAHFRAALRINPNFAKAHLDLGCALLEAGGRDQEARAELEAALRLRPDWEPVVARFMRLVRPQ